MEPIAIGDLLKPHLQRINVKVPSLADLRDALPELRDVPDSSVSRHATALSLVIESKQRCMGCTDYTTCWRAGDSAGTEEVVQVVGESIQIRGRECKPRNDYVARKRHVQLLQEAGMTESDRRYTFANFPAEQKERHPDLLAEVETFANAHQPGGNWRGIYVFGTPGVGKTHLVLAVINRLIDRGILAVYVRLDDLIEKLRSAQFSEREVERLVAWYGSVPVLAIDEFAQTNKTEFALDKLFSILSKRTHAGLPTLFTSNFSPKDAYADVLEKWPEKVTALRSRLMSVNAAMMVGRDHRLSELKIFRPVDEVRA